MGVEEFEVGGVGFEVGGVELEAGGWEGAALGRLGLKFICAWRGRARFE